MMASLVVPTLGAPLPAPVPAAPGAPASFDLADLPSILAGGGAKQRYAIPGRAAGAAGCALARVDLRVYLKAAGASSKFLSPSAFVTDPTAGSCEGIAALLGVGQAVSSLMGTDFARDTLFCETSTGASKEHRFSSFYTGLRADENWGVRGSRASQESAVYAVTCTTQRDGGKVELAGQLYFGESGQGDSAKTCMGSRAFGGHAKAVVDLLSKMDTWSTSLASGALTADQLEGNAVGTLPKSLAIFIRQQQVSFPTSELVVRVVFHYCGVGLGLDSGLGDDPGATPQKLSSRAVEALLHHLHLAYCRRKGLRSLLMVRCAPSFRSVRTAGLSHFSTTSCAYLLPHALPNAGLPAGQWPGGLLRHAQGAPPAP
jgi:hypothetical protein